MAFSAFSSANLLITANSATHSRITKNFFPGKSPAALPQLQIGPTFALWYSFCLCVSLALIDSGFCTGKMRCMNFAPISLMLSSRWCVLLPGSPAGESIAD
jgi:hypothetical protein